MYFRLDAERVASKSRELGCARIAAISYLVWVFYSFIRQIVSSNIQSLGNFSSTSLRGLCCHGNGRCDGGQGLGDGPAYGRLSLSQNQGHPLDVLCSCEVEGVEGFSSDVIGSQEEKRLTFTLFDSSACVY